MTDEQWLAEQFERHRDRLESVAYRMLGSRTEAEDAVQEAWLRVSRAGTEGVENLGGWLTTVVSRVSLDVLRARKVRGGDAPEPTEAETAAPRDQPGDPEHDALLAESVGLALMVVLERLAPAERVAFVLHDLFDIPFEQIGPIVGRNPAATRQLASRARRRVRGGEPAPDGDNTRHRDVVTAFLAASRAGDFQTLLSLLDPAVVLSADGAAIAMGAQAEVRGAEGVAQTFSGRAKFAETALLDGEPGAIWAAGGQVKVAFAFAVEAGRIVGIELLSDPATLAEMDIRH